MGKWIGQICGYVYDEEKEKKPFAGLPDAWTCPLCGADKGLFAPEKKEAPKPAAAQIRATEEMKELSAGELSAVCSNLARGCEKQYKDQEAALFRQLAEFFVAAAPAVPDGDMETLSALIQRDLEEGYPALHGTAERVSDRGTQRICVWGKKVAGILLSLVQRYQKEGESFLESTHVWVCTVCGFLYVGDKAPELCPVCRVPAWKFEKIKGRD